VVQVSIANKDQRKTYGEQLGKLDTIALHKTNSANTQPSELKVQCNPNAGYIFYRPTKHFFSETHIPKFLT